jgi:hypothetical protein
LAERLTTRRGFAQLLALAALAGPAAANQEAISRMLLDASRALQARNAALFLGHFDRKRFEAYSQLESNIVVLTEQKDIASSIRIVEVTTDGEDFLSRVDWLIQISPLDRPGLIETRRHMIALRVAAAGKKWRIAGLDPVDFFRPA